MSFGWCRTLEMWIMKPDELYCGVLCVQRMWSYRLFLERLECEAYLIHIGVLVVVVPFFICYIQKQVGNVNKIFRNKNRNRKSPSETTIFEWSPILPTLHRNDLYPKKDQQRVIKRSEIPCVTHSNHNTFKYKFRRCDGEIFHLYLYIEPFRSLHKMRLPLNSRRFRLCAEII